MVGKLLLGLTRSDPMAAWNDKCGAAGQLHKAGGPWLGASFSHQGLGDAEPETHEAESVSASAPAVKEPGG